jgi:hypothetical protein
VKTIATKFRPAATSALERANVPTTCQCCGKEELKKTVKVISTDGTTVLWMGTGCAAKACGVGVKEFGRALKGEQDAEDTREREEADLARRAEMARWRAHLDARCPEHRGDIFRQLQALGGMKAARAGYSL